MGKSSRILFSLDDVLFYSWAEVDLYSREYDHNRSSDRWATLADWLRQRSIFGRTVCHDPDEYTGCLEECLEYRKFEPTLPKDFHPVAAELAEFERRRFSDPLIKVLRLDMSELARFQANYVRPQPLDERHREPTAGGDLVERVLAGKRVDLTPAGVAELQCYLRKLTSNLSLNTSPDVSEQAKKRPGRPKADYETQEYEAKLRAAWLQAREAGVRKAEFVRGHKTLTVKELDKLLDRVSKRERGSE